MIIAESFASSYTLTLMSAMIAEKTDQIPFPETPSCPFSKQSHHSRSNEDACKHEDDTPVVLGPVRVKQEVPSQEFH